MPSVDYDPGRDLDTDLFAVLGTEWGADPEAVRRAWRANSRAAHPDAGGSHEAFIAMQHAWEVLSDPSRRARYVRAYEARHGPQRSTSGFRRRPSGGTSGTRGGSTGGRGDGARSGARGAGGPRRSDGPRRRCGGVTSAGMPCANPASPGSDRCWRHTRSCDESTGAPSGGQRAAWRCAAFVTFQGTRLPCHYNRLIGGNHCWDHAGEAERRAAIAEARGRCAALTQAGRPCRNARSSLGFPLCDTHLTIGVFTTYERSSHGRRTAPAPDDPGPRSWTPPGTTPPRPGAGQPARSDPPPRRRTGPPPPPRPGTRPSGGQPGADRGHAARGRTDGHDRAGQSRPGAGRSARSDEPPGPRTGPPPPPRPGAGPSGRQPGAVWQRTTRASASGRDRTGQSRRPPGFFPPFTTVRVPYAMVRRDWRRHYLAAGAVATLCVAVLVAGVAAVAYRLNRPQPIAFSADIKATSAHCSAEEPLTADEVDGGFDLTCTMADDAPGNRDRPYVQVRIDGCDDWQRLDHDDGPDPVTITARLAPCGTPVETLDWQVCQTHGGPLPDDCHDGTTDLSSD